MGVVPDAELELLDVVNGEDAIIGQASREKIHRNGLRHRAVHILVFNDEDDILVQRRALTKRCAPGLWDSSAAGHVDAGEAYRAAAQREVEEELGISTLDGLTYLFKLPASEATGSEFVEVFQTLASQVVQPDPTEIMDYRWCTWAALDIWLDAEPHDFTEVFRTIWARWRLTARDESVDRAGTQELDLR